MSEDAIPLSELIGNQAVRGLCGGITRPTLIAWRESHGFPAPVLQIDRTEVWDARQVIDWLAAQPAGKSTTTTRNVRAARKHARDIKRRKL